MLLIAGLGIGLGLCLVFLVKLLTGNWVAIVVAFILYLFAGMSFGIGISAAVGAGISLILPSVEITTDSATKNAASQIYI